MNHKNEPEPKAHEGMSLFCVRMSSMLLLECLFSIRLVQRMSQIEIYYTLQNI